MADLIIKTEPLCDDDLTRCQSGHRLDAVSSSNPFVASSAARLQSDGWNENAFWESSVESGDTYEAVAKSVDAWGMQWLLCYGKNTVSTQQSQPQLDFQGDF